MYFIVYSLDFDTMLKTRELQNKLDQVDTQMTEMFRAKYEVYKSRYLGAEINLLTNIEECSLIADVQIKPW